MKVNNIKINKLYIIIGFLLFLISCANRGISTIENTEKNDCINQDTLTNREYPFITPQNEFLYDIEREILSEYPEEYTKIGNYFSFDVYVDKNGKIKNVEVYSDGGNIELSDYIKRRIEYEVFLFCRVCEIAQLIPNYYIIIITITKKGLDFYSAFYLKD